jgi:drug/metabolite transporter (DMT)-like permease
MKTAACLTLIVLCGTAGDVAFARAMKRAGDRADLRWSTVLRTFARASRAPVLWLGVALHAVAFFAFLVLLSWAAVSFVVPATALGYAASAASARLFLHERVTGRRWAGVLLVSFGVMLVLLG